MSGELSNESLFHVWVLCVRGVDGPRSDSERKRQRRGGQDAPPFSHTSVALHSLAAVTFQLWNKSSCPVPTTHLKERVVVETLCLSLRLSRLADPLLSRSQPTGTVTLDSAGQYPFPGSVPSAWQARNGVDEGRRVVTAVASQPRNNNTFILRALTPAGRGRVRHCELGGLRLSLGIGARRCGGTTLGRIVQL